MDRKIQLEAEINRFVTAIRRGTLRPPPLPRPTREIELCPTVSEQIARALNMSSNF